MLLAAVVKSETQFAEVQTLEAAGKGKLVHIGPVFRHGRLPDAIVDRPAFLDNVEIWVILVRVAVQLVDQ